MQTAVANGMLGTEPDPGAAHSPGTRPSPLAIVGIGCLFPKSAGTGYYWANVKQGVDCIGEVPPTHWDPADYFDADPKQPDMTYARRGGFLDAVEFNPLEFGIAPRDIEATDTTQLLGLVAAKQALADAGVQYQPSDGPQSPRTVDRDRISVILGVTGTLELVIPLGARLGHPKWKRAMQAAGIARDQIEDAAGRIAESYVPWQENSFPGLLGNVVAGRIANRLDLGGTNCVVDAACASSLSAVHLAALELQANRADVVVTGGCDTFNDIFMYMCFSKTPALSPTGNARPFDADGDGTILGEGLGMVVLKRLADAERAGDTIYAVIRGIGSSSDGKGNAIYAPSAGGQKKCLRNAYAIAGVTPDTIELVEAHGTGTKVGDATEATALTEVYASASRPRPWVALGSVKSQIGHTKAAAGAASLIKAALALHFKVLPPSIKVTRPVAPLDAADSPFYVNSSMRPWLPRSEHPRRAALSAFGFGGSNFHAVLEEYRPVKDEIDWDGSVEIVALGAGSPESLAAELAQVPAEWVALAKYAERSRASFTAGSPFRLTFAAHRGRTDLAALLAGARAKLAADPQATTWRTAEGVNFASGPAAGKLGVLFPGQGSQTVGMLRELACQFPEMLESLGTANSAVAAGETGRPRLSDLIYPPSTFDPARKQYDDLELRGTNNAQPALGAVSYGAWQVLSRRFGVSADAFAGHSYGELVALAAGGRITAQELFTLSHLRGRLMGEQREGDAGGMLAVLAPAADIDRIVADRSLDLVVANRNSPTQTVLSGSTKEIDRAAEVFARAGLSSSKLSVAAAFHSRFVASAAIPFRAALENVGFPAGQHTVFANTTAAEYPADPAAARDLLAQQLARPVEFVQQVRAMVDAGVRTFVEVGPGTVLTRLAAATLADAGCTGCAAFPLDASGGKRSGMLDLAECLAQLLARGHDVKLAAWEDGSRCRPRDASANRPGMTISLTGANYVSPREPRPPVTRNCVHKTLPAALPRTTARNPQAPTMADADPSTVAQALLMTQQSLAALQRMQEQTAALHKQFLESQETAQRTLHALVEQQQSLLLSGLGAGVPHPAAPATPTVARAAAMPVSAPAPQVQPVAARPEPAAATAKAPANGTARDQVTLALIAVVSEKTGYPAESLDLGLSLDADLGVDSIKRVEILSALQEKLPGAPVVKPEHLGTLHTLRDVAEFLAGPGSAAPTAAATTPAATAAAPAQGQITAVLLEVIAEKTGYPASSLDAGMSLDADLGVDSIKRVEILSAVKEKLPGAPEVKAEHLGTLHTIRDVAQFLADSGRSSGKEAGSTAAAMVRSVLTPVVAVSGTSELQAPDTEHVAAIAQQKPAGEAARPRGRGSDSTRQPGSRSSSELTARAGMAPIPSDRVDRSIVQAGDLDLGSPRPRVSLAPGGEIWIIAEREPLSDAIADLLTGHGLKPKLQAWSALGSVKPSGPLAGLILLAPPAADVRLNGQAFAWLKALAPGLRPAGRGPASVFVSISRLDGAFGLANLAPDCDPTAGGLAGLVKTARHEMPEVACKAIDLDPAFAPASIAAAAVVDEILSIGPVEVGIARSHRCTLELARTVRRPGPQLINLGTKDVILVTGGARGVTAETAVALAETYSPTLILTGRTPAPGAEPDWAQGLLAEADLKKAIAAKLGPDAGPRQIGETYQSLMAQREIRRTLERIAATGAKAAYLPVNITDGAAVAAMLQQVRAKHGPVTALVHGAGVLADRRIEDLTAEQFDTVYSTKVQGLRNVLSGIGRDELKAIVLFSSTTARFGRVGQAAYASANEVLNKIAQVEARRRPGCRVVSINWGPWEGGMVTPALRKVFESEGVGLIPLLDGAVFLVQELNAAGKAVEVVAMPKPRGGSGGIPIPAGYSNSTPPPVGAPATGSGVVPNMPPAELALAFERSVDVASHPVLKAHVLDGRAVLPMALHLEWLAHAALHGNPGLVFHGFNDLRITHGVHVESGSVNQLRAFAGKAVRQDKLFVVPVELRGKRKDGREIVHSRGEIVLVSALPPAPVSDHSPKVKPLGYPVPQAYREMLFHGPELHGIERIDGASDTAFIGGAFPAPVPAEWFQTPLRATWVSDPLVLDASFQMMILWTISQHDTGSLPCFVGRYRQYRKTFPQEPTTVVIRIRRDDGKFARADIDYLDRDGRTIAQMQDYECVMEKNLHQAFRRNQLAAK